MESHKTLPASVAKFNMIDISEKLDTQRRAVASGVFYAAAATILRIKSRTIPKGDVLLLSEIAGIQGAKKTSELLPLCHPLALTSVRIWHEIINDQIRVYSEVKSVGKTGVEMEALAAVSAALLCIYDLTKGIDPVLRMGEIKLEIKEGGKSGLWSHPNSELVKNLSVSVPVKTFDGIKAAVIVLSDRCSRGESEDRSGPVASKWLSDRGAEITSNHILPDDRKILCNTLTDIVKQEEPDLIITSGGTGLSVRDITPETILAFANEFGGREIPGIGEVLRSDGSKKTKMSWLSRSTAVLVGKTIIVCLPGKPSAVTEGLESIAELILHARHTASGGDHDHSK